MYTIGFICILCPSEEFSDGQTTSDQVGLEENAWKQARIVCLDGRTRLERTFEPRSRQPLILLGSTNDAPLHTSEAIASRLDILTQRALDTGVKRRLCGRHPLERRAGRGLGERPRYCIVSRLRMEAPLRASCFDITVSVLERPGCQLGPGTGPCASEDFAQSS